MHPYVIQALKILTYSGDGKMMKQFKALFVVQVAAGVEGSTQQ